MRATLPHAQICSTPVTIFYLWLSIKMRPKRPLTDKDRERHRDRQETRHAGFYTLCVLGLPRGPTIRVFKKMTGLQAQKMGEVESSGSGAVCRCMKSVCMFNVCVCECMCVYCMITQGVPVNCLFYVHLRY